MQEVYLDGESAPHVHEVSALAELHPLRGNVSDDYYEVDPKAQVYYDPSASVLNSPIAVRGISKHLSVSSGLFILNHETTESFDEAVKIFSTLDKSFAVSQINDCESLRLLGVTQNSKYIVLAHRSLSATGTLINLLVIPTVDPEDEEKTSAVASSFCRKIGVPAKVTLETPPYLGELNLGYFLRMFREKIQSSEKRQYLTFIHSALQSKYDLDPIIDRGAAKNLPEAIMALVSEKIGPMTSFSTDFNGLFSQEVGENAQVTISTVYVFKTMSDTVASSNDTSSNGVMCSRAALPNAVPLMSQVLENLGNQLCEAGLGKPSVQTCIPNYHRGIHSVHLVLRDEQGQLITWQPNSTLPTMSLGMTVASPFFGDVDIDACVSYCLTLDCLETGTSICPDLKLSSIDDALPVVRKYFENLSLQLAATEEEAVDPLSTAASGISKIDHAIPFRQANNENAVQCYPIVQAAALYETLLNSEFAIPSYADSLYELEQNLSAPIAGYTGQIPAPLYDREELEQICITLTQLSRKGRFDSEILKLLMTELVALYHISCVTEDGSHMEQAMPNVWAAVNFAMQASLATPATRAAMALIRSTNLITTLGHLQRKLPKQESIVSHLTNQLNKAFMQGVGDVKQP